MTELLLRVKQRDLSEIHSWDPDHVLESVSKPSWPVAYASALSDLTSKIIPSRGYEGPFVKVNDIDDVSGAVTIRTAEQRDWVYAVRQPGGLQAGDLLLSSNKPTLYITEAFTDLQFSTLLAAIRPREGVDSLWIWACLNSTIGRTLLKSSGRGALHHQVQLSQIEIPEMTDTWNQTREKVMALANHVSNELQTVDKGGSWWRTTQLPVDTPWSALLAVQDPAALTEGTRLGDLITTVMTGKRTTTFDSPSIKSTLPVWGAAQLRGKRPTQYADIDAGVVAEQGDILIQKIGLRGTAAVMLEPCIAEPNVLVLKLHDPELNSIVVSAFNSPAGQRQRSYRATGTVIPSLSADSLKEIRLDLTVKQPSNETIVTPLSDQLDELIWS